MEIKWGVRVLDNTKAWEAGKVCVGQRGHHDELFACVSRF